MWVALCRWDWWRGLSVGSAAVVIGGESAVWVALCHWDEEGVLWVALCR